MSFFQKKDFWLVAAILLAAGVAFFLFGRPGRQAGLQTDIVEIYLGNSDTPSQTVPFGEAQVLKIDQDGDRHNEITITDDAVYMSHSTCHNQECVKQGKITMENIETRLLGDYIICLPNQVVVKVVRAEENS